MQRIEVDCGSGLVTVIDMTPEEAAAISSPNPTPACVSARQFKLQLLSFGLIDQVDAWVSSQPREVKIAYEYSGTFVRNSPMMEVGFAQMGFTPQQIDEFFTAAAQL